MNSSTEIIEGFDTLNSIGLSVLDAKCYRALTLKMIEALKVFPSFALSGDEACYNYLFIMLSVDMSVFADETIELLTKSGESREEILSEFSPDFNKRLKSVRNNMHLHNKHGSYKSKADKIIAVLDANFIPIYRMDYMLFEQTIHWCIKFKQTEDYYVDHNCYFLSIHLKEQNFNGQGSNNGNIQKVLLQL